MDNIAARLGAKPGTIHDWMARSGMDAGFDPEHADTSLRAGRPFSDSEWFRKEEDARRWLKVPGARIPIRLWSHGEKEPVCKTRAVSELEISAAA